MVTGSYPVIPDNCIFSQLFLCKPNGFILEKYIDFDVSLIVLVDEYV